MYGPYMADGGLTIQGIQSRKGKTRRQDKSSPPKRRCEFKYLFFSTTTNPISPLNVANESSNSYCVCSDKDTSKFLANPI